MKKVSKDFCERFELEFPIIQAGMVWVSGSKLASACANEGIMGTIGAGSMNLEILEYHLRQALELTHKEHRNKLAINLPLLYGKIQKQIELALKYDIKNFITSAGSPKKFTNFLKDKNKNVFHVTSSSDLAIKCEAAGVDAIIAEGFEAGGHNGRNETTTMVLIPNVVDQTSLPIIAAGGISNARQIKAAHELGASAVQVGSRFVIANESSAHDNFKNEIINSKEGSTSIRMKNIVPVRLLDNPFSEKIKSMENTCASKEDLIKHLGKGRARDGMLNGDLVNGELEIGQVSSSISKQLSAKDIITELKAAYGK